MARDEEGHESGPQRLTSHVLFIIALCLASPLSFFGIRTWSQEDRTMSIRSWSCEQNKAWVTCVFLSHLTECVRLYLFVVCLTCHSHSPSCSSHTAGLNISVTERRGITAQRRQAGCVVAVAWAALCLCLKKNKSNLWTGAFLASLFLCCFPLPTVSELITCPHLILKTAVKSTQFPSAAECLHKQRELLYVRLGNDSVLQGNTAYFLKNVLVLKSTDLHGQNTSTLSISFIVFLCIHSGLLCLKCIYPKSITCTLFSTRGVSILYLSSFLLSWHFCKKRTLYQLQFMRILSCFNKIVSTTKCLSRKSFVSFYFIAR